MLNLSILSIIWIGLIIVFSVIEFSTAALVSIWFVVGSIAAFLVSLFTTSLLWQFVVFVGVSGVCFAIFVPMLQKSQKNKAVATNANLIIGKDAVVTQEIDVKTTGRVDIDGISWLARADKDIPAGTVCTVKALQGAAVVVAVKEDTLINN